MLNCSVCVLTVQLPFVVGFVERGQAAKSTRELFGVCSHRSAAMHDDSYDNPYTASELSAVEPWFIRPARSQFGK